MVPVRRIALSTATLVVASSLSWPGDAAAQDSTPSPATESGVSSAQSEPVEASEARTTGAPPDWSGDSTQRDRVVLKPPASTRWWLIGAGLASTAVWYGAGYGINALWPDAPGAHSLRVPVAGPFIDLAKTGCPKDDSDCSTFELVLRTILVSLDALGQAGGVGLVIEGAVFSPSGVEPPRSAQSKPWQKPDRAPTVLPVPMPMGQTGAGLGLVGRF